jgi:hypothetical protein
MGIAGDPIRVAFSTGSGGGPIHNQPILGDGIDATKRISQYILVRHPSQASLMSYEIDFDFSATLHEGSPSKYIVRRYNKRSGWTTIPSTVSATHVKTDRITHIVDPNSSQTEDIIIVGEPSTTDIAWNTDGIHDSRVQAFPNPTSDFLTVTIDNASGRMFTVKLIDMNGRIVMERDCTQSAGVCSWSLSLGHLAKAVYLLRVDSEFHPTHVMRVVVR